MRLHRLYLRNFRGTTERTVPFAERGVTVVEGPNESGKSSLAEALDLLLGFQAHSKAQAVRRVQPAGEDVATEVTADLSCGPYRFTYSKRFNREHATTLEIHDPAAEQLTGAAAHDRVQALLAEHVDEALWRALRICQDVPLEQADLSAQTSLAAALDAAAGARVGGEREAALFERITAEFERYHTAGGQPTKARRELGAAVEAASAEVAEAREALRAVEDDIARCADLTRALDALGPQLAAARAQAQRAECAWRALERRQLEVDQLGVTAERALAEHARAADQHARRQALIDRCADAEREVAEAEAALERHTPAASAAAGDVLDAERRAATQRAAAAVVRERARRCERDVDALRDAETLARIDERIGQIEAAHAGVAAAEAELAGEAVDDDALEAVEAALADVHRARAVAEAESPLLTVRRHARVAVTVDGENAGDEPTVERRVSATTTVRVGDVAEIVLDPGRDARERLDRVVAAERVLADLLAGCGAVDVAAARAAHRRRADAATELGRSRRALGDLLGEDTLAALRERRAAAAARAGAAGRGRERTPDVEAARDRAEAARAEADRCEEQLAAMETALRDALARREALATAGAGLRVRVEAAVQALAEVTGALEGARAEAPDDALAAALAAGKAAAAEAETAHRSARDRLEVDDPAGAQAAATEAAAVRDRLAKEQRTLEDELRDTRARLAVRGEEGLYDRLSEAERHLDELAREHARAEARATAARLLRDEMAARREDATRAYAAPLRDRLTSLGRIVFGEEFAVQLGDDLRITRRTLRGVTLDFADLSTGAREQLCLLTRLAVAALVAPDGGVPLLLDDALGSSDPARLERLGAALRLGARDAQVIVLTCVPERYRTIGDAAVVRLP